MKSELAFDDYRKIEAVNHSSLKNIDISPFYYNYMLNADIKPTESMQLGTLLHAMVLEPEKAKQYVVAPVCDKRTKEGKAAYANFLSSLQPNAKIVSAENLEIAKEMVTSLREDATATKLIESFTDVEKTYAYNREGFSCKARVDGITSHGIFVDIKTITKLTDAAFGRAVEDYSYDTQAEWYLNAGEGESFVFIVVESSPPFDCCCYVVPQEVIEAARKVNVGRLDKLKEALEVGSWKGLGGNGLRELPLTWKLKQRLGV